MKVPNLSRFAVALACYLPLLVNGDPATEATAAVTRTDCEAALRTWRDWAQQVDAGAQHFLATLYFNGQGVARDDDEAARWLRKSAEQGLAYAQYDLSVAYAMGRGVAKDEAEQVRWDRKAAEQGFAPAQHNLGSWYINGTRGVTKDEAEGIRWFRKAAEQGWVPSQGALAAAYIQGKGVPKDLVEAYMWATIGMEGTQPGPVRLQTARARDEFAKLMTQAQVEQASQLAREWKQTGTAIYPDARFARLGEISKAAGGETINAATYTVPTPMGEDWEVQVDSYNDTVAFTKSSLATKELTRIGVARRDLELTGGARSEAEVVTAIECSEEANLREQGKAKSYTLDHVSKQIENIDGKSLYVMRYVITDRRLGTAVEANEAAYTYFPPNWKQSKRAYLFSLAQPQKIGDAVLATDTSEIGLVISGFREK
jgi:TPR repeat protein